MLFWKKNAQRAMCDKREPSPQQPQILLAWHATTAHNITRRTRARSSPAQSVTQNTVAESIWQRRGINRARNAMETFQSQTANRNTSNRSAVSRMAIRSSQRFASLREQ